MKFKKFYISEGVLNVAKLKSLKKDFLSLAKNADIVKDYDQTIKWMKVQATWNKKFDIYLEEIVDDLNDLKFKKEITDSDWKYWDEKIRTDLWRLYIENSVPISLADDYYTKETRYNDFVSKKKTWQNRVKRFARTAWKTLDDFRDWHERVLKKEFYVDEEKEERMDIKGYNVILKYGKGGYPKPDVAIKNLAKALDIIKSVKPKSLVRKLPIIVDITKKTGIDKGGEYSTFGQGKKGVIRLFPSPMSSKPKNLAYVILHEIAHRTWNVLDKKKTDLWNKFMSGNWGTIDLKDVYNKYAQKGDKSFWDNKYIKRKNPDLYLQMQGLYDQRRRMKDFENILSMEQLKQYLDNGGNPIVHVHRKPISGYAHKNDQEAFSEASALWGVYGERAVHKEVLAMLKRIYT